MSDELVERLVTDPKAINWTEVTKSYPALEEAMVAEEHGGGGWHLAGSPHVSQVTGDVTFKHRCNSFHAYGCPASVRLVFRKALGTVHVEASTGWAHTHTGVCKAITGLPPSIKFIVDHIIASHPGIKAKAVKNMLWETHSTGA